MARPSTRKSSGFIAIPKPVPMPSGHKRKPGDKNLWGMY
jgi:hypothetical protein